MRISSEDPKAPLLAISKYNANIMKRQIAAADKKRKMNARAACLSQRQELSSNLSIIPANRSQQESPHEPAEKDVSSSQNDPLGSTSKSRQVSYSGAGAKTTPGEKVPIDLAKVVAPPLLPSAGKPEQNLSKIKVTMRKVSPAPPEKKVDRALNGDLGHLSEAKPSGQTTPSPRRLDVSNASTPQQLTATHFRSNISGEKVPINLPAAN